MVAELIKGPERVIYFPVARTILRRKVHAKRNMPMPQLRTTATFYRPPSGSAIGAASSLGAAFHFTYSGRQPPNLPGAPKRLGHDGQKEDNMTNNILKLAQQARTNAQLLTVSQGGIQSLTREDALKTRGDVVEAIRRLQVFEKDLAKKLDT